MFSICYVSSGRHKGGLIMCLNFLAITEVNCNLINHDYYGEKFLDQVDFHYQLAKKLIIFVIKKATVFKNLLFVLSTV
mgnify:CR=1 FL=1